jgi:hypothetical protein
MSMRRWWNDWPEFELGLRIDRTVTNRLNHGTIDLITKLKCNPSYSKYAFNISAGTGMLQHS